MSRKVTIIGAGSVGSTITYTMAVNGLASEIVMIDVNTERALGEAMDIRQGTPFVPRSRFMQGLMKMRRIRCSGHHIWHAPVRPGQSRIDLAQTNGT